MQSTSATRPTGFTHYLLFGSLFHLLPSLSFPCDAAGRVQIDCLSERARDNYFFARTVVGRDYMVPVVTPARESA